MSLFDSLVSFSTDSVPLIELPDSVPLDLDYDRYIEESEKLLKSIGLGTDTQPVKDTETPTIAMSAAA
jgi:hypothetical protein